MNLEQFRKVKGEEKKVVQYPVPYQKVNSSSTSLAMRVSYNFQYNSLVLLKRISKNAVIHALIPTMSTSVVGEFMRLLEVNHTL